MDLQKLGNRAAKSIVALVSRTFLLNIISFIGSIALTIFLTPTEFGVYIITSTIVDIMTYFSDVGLAGALIQKKGKLEANEIETTFTIQQLLIISLILIGFVFYKPISAFYKLDNVAINLYFALLISFFISSLKTIPSVLSERKLQFEKVVIPQIVETLFFNVILVYLAWKGFGVTSYIWAVSVRAIVGTITIYLLVPWRPKLNFHFQSVKNLLKFGIPYQGNSLLAVFKDKISLLILGKIIGLNGMGMLGWAEKWANLPLRYVLDATVKVAFPLFSRLQDNLEKAQANLERAIYFISIIVFPMLVGGLFLMPSIIAIIPKYGKWSPAILAFNFYLFSAAIASISTFLTNFLTGMGKVKQVLGLMLMWTVLTLIIYPLFAIKWGYTGVAIGSTVIAITSIIPALMVYKLVPINFFKQLYPAIISTLGMGIVLFIAKQSLSKGLYSLFILPLIGAVSYFGLLWIINGKNLKSQILTFINYAKS